MTLKHCRFHSTRSLFKAKRVIFNEIGGQTEDLKPGSLSESLIAFEAQHNAGKPADTEGIKQKYMQTMIVKLTEARRAADERDLDNVIKFLGLAETCFMHIYAFEKGSIPVFDTMEGDHILSRPSSLSPEGNIPNLKEAMDNMILALQQNNIVEAFRCISALKSFLI